eukprot:TRINITY_DN35140_c0_g1_i1.p1 TRINITY_DN35140_c0_g1~~TRINITY_DN35140_c0_g1_i1.p1  ORF type:complete len:169 (+),score=1.10 TRINITY_DN35140_c0_g1_i1:163-669(+)
MAARNRAPPKRVTSADTSQAPTRLSHYVCLVSSDGQEFVVQRSLLAPSSTLMWRLDNDSQLVNPSTNIGPTAPTEANASSAFSLDGPSHARSAETPVGPDGYISEEDGMLRVLHCPQASGEVLAETVRYLLWRRAHDGAIEAEMRPRFDVPAHLATELMFFAYACDLV